MMFAKSCNSTYYTNSASKTPGIHTTHNPDVILLECGLYLTSALIVNGMMCVPVTQQLLHGK